MSDYDPGKINYQLKSVEKIMTPEGMPGNNWHRYIIEHGKSVIEGTKPGTLKSVTEHAQQVTDDMNARSKKGGSYFAPTSRQHKKTE